MRSHLDLVYSGEVSVLGGLGQHIFHHSRAVRLGAVVADGARLGGGATVAPGSLVGPDAHVHPGSHVDSNLDEGVEVRR